MLKHRVKMWLRRSVAGIGFSSGIWRMANRFSRSGRITVLTLHCVGFPDETEYLPSYMKLREKEFDGLLKRLSASFEIISLPEAVSRLEGGGHGKNAFVITLDDGYRDNLTHALPILVKHGIPATIFLEAGAIDRRSLSWIHKFFFVDNRKGSVFLAEEYSKRTKGSRFSKKVEAAAVSGENAEYAVKKLLKYEADVVERDRIIHEIFCSLGGNEKEILDSAYLDWDDVKTMLGQGISFGCHTMSHPILSTLARDKARAEIVESKMLMEEKLGIEVDSFAYPWGRMWDFNGETVDVLKKEGFKCALTMDEKAVLPGKCDLFRLSRYPLAEGFSTADIVAEASGIYSLFGGRLL